MGCKVISAARSASKQRSRKPAAFSRKARYSGRYLPACRISQTGGMGSRSPASTRSNGLRTIGTVTLLPETKSFLENLVVVLGRLIELIQLSAHVIHAQPTYSHSGHVDETAVEGAHLRGFSAGIGGLRQCYPHFTDPRTPAWPRYPEGT